MSQQQLTESKLPITLEVLIETETKFRNALTANKSTAETKQIQIIKIIPPFWREIVKSAERSGAGISKLCFRYTETIPHNNATEDDNRKNNNCDKRSPQTSYTDSYCSPRSRAIHN